MSIFSNIKNGMTLQEIGLFQNEA